MTTLAGGCHCGSVRFVVELPAPIPDLLDCNCTICTKKGFLHLIVDEDRLRCDDRSAIATYTFGTHTAKHLFCRTCGMHPFYRPRSHPDSWDVNARCLDNFEPSAWTITPFDGRNWEASVDTIRPIALAKNGAAALLAESDAALERGEIDDAGWYARVAAVITPAYLAAPTAWGQSGRSGDAASWERARGFLVEGMRPGAFLDIGCANGYLLETLVPWCAARGIAIEPYGLDIAPELVALARSRLPAWHDRFFIGNAIDWTPPRRFDVVRTGLEYVPAARQQALVAHLLEYVVAPGGRLIIGVYNEERDSRVHEAGLAARGFTIAGRAERDHADPRLAYRILWIDR